MCMRLIIIHKFIIWFLPGMCMRLIINEKYSTQHS